MPPNFIILYNMARLAPQTSFGWTRLPLCRCPSSWMRSRAGDPVLPQAWQRVLLTALLSSWHRQSSCQRIILPPTVSFPTKTWGEEADRLLLNEPSVTGGAQGRTSAKPARDDSANRSRGKAESLPPPEP